MEAEALTDEDPDYWHGYIDDLEASLFLGVSVRALQDWRLKGRGPRFHKIGRLVRYTRSELREWAE